MKLFQSSFGRGEAVGRYPESLLEMAIERAVDGTDSRLRLLPGYRKRLRKPVIQAIDHVIPLVDAIAAPVAAGRSEHGTEPRLAAMFASAEDMLDIFGRDTALADFLASPEGTACPRVTTLLLAERVERNILGMDLVGDQVRRDVQHDAGLHLVRVVARLLEVGGRWIHLLPVFDEFLILRVNTRDKYYRYLRGGGGVMKIAKHSYPGLLRHRNVERNEIRKLLLRKVHALPAIICLDNAVALLREITFHEGDQPFFIVHNENCFCHKTSWRKYTNC